jgi:hypothetical protein
MECYRWETYRVYLGRHQTGGITGARGILHRVPAEDIQAGDIRVGEIQAGDTQAVDVVDETFLVVPPKIVASAFADPLTWRRYWPDLTLSVYADRGDEGLRWTVRGALVGTMEVWLEPMLDGTLLHYFLRARTATPLQARAADRERRRRQLAAKRIALELKSVLENGRAPGCAP